MKLITLFVLLPLALMAEPIPLTVSGETPTATWTASWVPSILPRDGLYDIYFSPFQGMVTGYTVQFSFPDGGYDQTVVIATDDYQDNGAAGPDIWDSAHQIATITVIMTQPDVTEQVASVQLSLYGTIPPTISFLNITTADVLAAPEPSSFALTLSAGILAMLSGRRLLT